MESALLFQIQSFIVFGLLSLGLYFKKSKEKHMKIMLTAIIWDVLLILQIELNRGAILKASHALTNPFILNFHVTMAVTCVIGYIFMIYSGRFLKIGEQKLRKLHKKIGMTTYTLRLITLITSFYAVIPKK